MRSPQRPLFDGARFRPRGARRSAEDSAPKARAIVSLFSGCGGMDLGFVGDFSFGGRHYDRLPNRVVFANDVSEAACRTYAQNIGEHIRCAKLENSFNALPRSCDIVIGGFPCQDVSINGKRQAASGSRTVLYRSMIEVVERLQPRVFVAENVKGLLSSDLGEQVLADFGALEGYQVNSRVYLASDYGVPQNRERLIIVGVKGARPFEHPAAEVERRMTCDEAIGDLAHMTPDDGIAHIWSKAKRSPDQGSRRLKAQAPATTMRAEHHGNVQWHYSLDRRISLREQARLQSFPDEFAFHCGMRESERQIGNAVPPVMAWCIARAIQEQMFSA